MKRKEEEPDKVEVEPGVTYEKLEMFQSHVDWTDPRTPKAASVAPIEKPEKPESMMSQMLCLWVQLQGSCDPRGASNGSRLTIYQTLYSERLSLCCASACMCHAFV